MAHMEGVLGTSGVMVGVSGDNSWSRDSERPESKG